MIIPSEILLEASFSDYGDPFLLSTLLKEQRKYRQKHRSTQTFLDNLVDHIRYAFPESVIYREKLIKNSDFSPLLSEFFKEIPHERNGGYSKEKILAVVERFRALLSLLPEKDPGVEKKKQTDSEAQNRAVIYFASDYVKSGETLPDYETVKSSFKQKFPANPSFSESDYLFLTEQIDRLKQEAGQEVENLFREAITKALTQDEREAVQTLFPFAEAITRRKIADKTISSPENQMQYQLAVVGQATEILRKEREALLPKPLSRQEAFLSYIPSFLKKFLKSSTV